MKAIACSQCGHENDATRVFCQNCGARLENPEAEALAAPAPAVMAPPPPGFRRKQRREGRNPFLVLLRALVLMVILGATLAAIIQMGRRPNGLPPAKPGNEATAGQLLQVLQTFSESPYVRTCDVTQDQANNYLAATVLPSEAPSQMSLQAQFRRAFVVLGQGDLRFVVEQSFLGLPVFLHLVAFPQAAGEGTTMEVTGGGIGRMPLHPKILPWLRNSLQPVVGSTSAATNVLRKARAVAISPGSARLSWQARKPAAP